MAESLNPLYSAEELGLVVVSKPVFDPHDILNRFDVVKVFVPNNPDVIGLTEPDRGRLANTVSAKKIEEASAVIKTWMRLWAIGGIGSLVALFPSIYSLFMEGQVDHPTALVLGAGVLFASCVGFSWESNFLAFNNRLTDCLRRAEAPNGLVYEVPKHVAENMMIKAQLK